MHNQKDYNPPNSSPSTALFCILNNDKYRFVCQKYLLDVYAYHLQSDFWNLNHNRSSAQPALGTQRVIEKLLIVVNKMACANVQRLIVKSLRMGVPGDEYLLCLVDQINLVHESIAEQAKSKVRFRAAAWLGFNF